MVFLDMASKDAVIDGCSAFVTQDALITVAITLIFVLVVLVVILIRQEKLMASSGQGFQDLTNAVNADAAELAAEQKAFGDLETAIQTLLNAGAAGVTDAQLETLAQSLQAAQAARQVAVDAAEAAVPPAAPPPSPSTSKS